jgi:exosortase
MTSSPSAGQIESAHAQTKMRIIWFLVAWLGSLAAFRMPLKKMAVLAFGDERYTYIAVVPVISALFIWMRRERLLRVSRYSPESGLPLALAGVCLTFFSARWFWLGEGEQLSVMACGILLAWIGLGALFFGPSCLREATFPLLFLLLVIPVPANLMDGAVIALQKASAEMTTGVFKVIGIPFLRNGFTFSLPGVDIEIAKECSGIRSSLSLLLSAIVAGYLFLRSAWSQLLLAVVTIPIVIFKNAVRIAIISWLGVYVDRSFFFGNLHHHGGPAFSVIAIAPMGVVLWFLYRAERIGKKLASAQEN